MNHLLQAVAWMLIHFCWEAAAVAILYGIAARITAHRSSHVRYLVALSAMAALVIAAGLTFTWEMAPPAQPAVLEQTLPSMPSQWQHATGKDMMRALGAEAPALADRLSALLLWIDALWLLGICGFSARNLGGWCILRRLSARAAGSLPPSELQSRFTRIAGLLGVRKNVLLRLSDAIAGPITVGAFRTVVLLPVSALTGLGPNELEVVLAHELAHVRRADFLCNLLQILVETLFFFHPAVWWISSRVRQERELCCDDLALDVYPDPVAYAGALFHLEEQRSRLHLAMALDGHQGRQTLSLRIARILGEQPSPSPRPVRPFSLAAVFAGLAILLLSAPQVVASLQPVHLVRTVAVAAHSVSASPQIRSAVAAISHKPTLALHAAQAAAPKPQQQAQPGDTAQATPQSADSAPHVSYIDAMKAAGYDVDLDKLLAMKIQNVTPEYARAMAQVGLGKPFADDLIACKIQGVSPEIIAQLKQQGLEVDSFQDAISYRIFNVTPEFVKGMKDAGFDHLDSKKLLSLRVQGVTPEYARSIVQQFPGASVDDVLSTRIFRIDSAFIASAKQHGFKDLTLKKLIQLRISGILDDESK